MTGVGKPMNKIEEMYNDFKDLIGDVEHLHEKGMKDTPNPPPPECSSWIKFYRAMVKITHNKAKRLRTKWLENDDIFSIDSQEWKGL